MSTVGSVLDTFRFLDLPREIPDQVYEITLNGKVAPPAQLNQRDRSSRHTTGLEARKGGAKYNGVLLHELQVPAMAGYGLLCSNRCLAGKMREALEG